MREKKRKRVRGEEERDKVLVVRKPEREFFYPKLLTLAHMLVLVAEELSELAKGGSPYMLITRMEVVTSLLWTADTAPAYGI